MAYECDPYKNIDCAKDLCFIYGGPCHYTTEEAYKMENEIRYYLKHILACMEPEDESAFKPTHLITAVKLPTGATEIAINTENIGDKIKYILEAYDDAMFLKTNQDIQMLNIMVV